MSGSRETKKLGIDFALLLLLILAVYLTACWVDGSKRLDECVCVDCTSATPKATVEIESEEGY